MDEIASRFAPLVHQINAVYEQLHTISDDELRAESSALEQMISQSADKSQAMDEQLVRTFAIAKETARRFASGQLCVTANDYDRRLAEDYDFVNIDGNQAIYKNRWDVNGIPVEWNMIHYDEQLLGGILLHYGYAVEMATGEGKTLVATLPVFLNALTHDGVHLMTSNAYLSKRDYETTRPLYFFHGLTADCIEYYLRDERRQKAYRADITFGANGTFTFDYLSDHLALSPDACVQQQHCFAIIDELDSILIDDADTPHIIGNRNYEKNDKIYTENLPIVKEALSNADFYDINPLRKTSSFTPAGKRWLAEKTGIAELFSVDRIYQIPDFNTLSPDAKHAIRQRLELQNVLQQLLLALTVFERDIDYIVEYGRVIIIDRHTGRAKMSCRWEYGLHTAIEVKEKVNVEPDLDSIAVISLKNYFRLYKKVAGMSGTIMPVADELAELYGLKCTALPTHRPIIRIDHPLRIFRTASLKDEAVINAILANRDAGRPTLVGNISIKRSEAIGKLLDAKEVSYNKLDAKTTQKEAIFIAKAGIGTTITVSTSVAGRGTDIKPSPDALAHGGLKVIGTDLFDSVRVDLQLKGRSGRQGNPGSSVFFASLDDIILRYLSDEDKHAMEQLAASIEGDELSCPEMLHYFEKAQANCEACYRDQRKETARKDDIVAPHRKKFYDQRNAVLFDAAASDAIIEAIACTSSTPKEAIETHLHELYRRTGELTGSVSRNNPDMQKVLIPYSVHQHPFALLLYIESLKNDFSYFKREFKRQAILHTYDRYWKQFVFQMMENLDENEVKALESKYEDMMTDIRSDILNKLLDSSILFDVRSGLPDAEQSNVTEQPPQRVATATLHPDEPCPCGSGKRYCECHGRNIRSNSVKRRRR